MPLLTSNINPVNFRTMKPLYEVFEEYAVRDVSELIKISTGFISVDSMVFVLENIRGGNINAVELVIGMHAFTGLTRRQYDLIKMLDSELRAGGRGWVKMCTAFPFHGKTFSFWRNGQPFAAVVGSSNIDSILKNQHLEYEVDALFSDKQMLNDIANLQKDLADKAAKSLDNWVPSGFISQPVFPPDFPDVEQISTDIVADYWRNAKDLSFRLELKTEEKSNLNCFFGKGRENVRTRVIRPRSWYEVEIVVSSKVTSLKGYPKYREFEVITNNGYKFWCKTQGDNCKNFRSKANLKILGMWIKGLMEEAGVLQVGEKVTDTTLKQFGKRYIKLTATDNPDLWLAELV